MGIPQDKAWATPNEYRADDGSRPREQPGTVARFGTKVKNAIGGVAARMRTETLSSTFIPRQPEDRRIVAAPVCPSPMPVPGTDENVAQEILGSQSFFGIGEALSRFRLTPNAAELETYPGIPWSAEELYEARDTHILVAGFRLSLVDMLERTPVGVFHCEHFGDWYRTHNCAFAVCQFVDTRWYFMRKDAVPGSYNKTFLNGRKLVAANEELPRACELAYAMALHHMVTGEWLLRRKYVWCSDTYYDKGCDARQVFVGAGYGEKGCLIVNSLYADTDADVDRGIAAQRKVPRRVGV